MNFKEWLACAGLQEKYDAYHRSWKTRLERLYYRDIEWNDRFSQAFSLIYSDTLEHMKTQESGFWDKIGDSSEGESWGGVVHVSVPFFQDP